MAPTTLNPPDFLVLYHTLERDGALPPPFEEEFCSLEVPVILAAAREDKKISTNTKMQATTWLQERHKQKMREAKLEKTAADQFFLAADKAPRRYRAKFQRGLYAGPNARKEAETERTKWIEVLAVTLSRTATPMGVACFASQQYAVLRRRQSCFNPQVPCPRSQRFLDWLALTNSKGFSTALEDSTGYLQARQSEPCTRGARDVHTKPWCSWRRFRVSPAKHTSPPLQSYLIVQKELLASSLPGRLSKQAPWMLISMLPALEQLTVDDRTLPSFMIYSWWVLVQSWGTLRFIDHRGLKPATSPSGRNPWSRGSLSRTTGDDKDVAFLLVHISDCYFFVSPSWAQHGLVDAELTRRFPS